MPNSSPIHFTIAHPEFPQAMTNLMNTPMVESFLGGAENSEPSALTCYHCKQRRSSEKQLSRCTGCCTAVYCGTACQRAAWPEHKAFCTKVQTSPSPRTKFLVRRANAVFAYASRHRPLLFSIAYHELKIRYDKENAARKVLWVGFKPRDYEETKWDVVRVEVRLVETLEEEVRDEIQSGRRLRLQDPVLNVFAIMLYDVECMVSKCLFGSVLDDNPERGLRIF